MSGVATSSGRWIEYAKYLQSCLPKHITNCTVYKDELTVHCRLPRLLTTLQFLHSHVHCQFKQLIDITAVDWPAKELRFDLVYMLQSIKFNARVRVKTETDELTPVPSCTSIWAGANWPEREVYDMYGIQFTEHPDLRRILTDYGFEGHPLRKDFPLSGFTEVRWDEEEKRVVSEPVQLTQEYRRFELDNAWQQVPDKGTVSSNPKDQEENFKKK